MRAWVLILALITAAPALAAPTCLTPKGDTIRCGVPGAMPVFWKPSPQVMWEREMAIKPPGPSKAELLGVFVGLALFLALIALLPDFDGWQADDDNNQDAK